LQGSAQLMDDTKALDDVSRRFLLKSVPAAAGMIIAIGGADVPDAALAQTKISHDVAKYQDTPKNDQQCSTCLQFVPPNSCKIVASPISPHGWCQFYAKKS
jgi:hypothetical protein